jgi:hypothetical protein
LPSLNFGSYLKLKSANERLLARRSSFSDSFPLFCDKIIYVNVNAAERLISVNFACANLLQVLDKLLEFPIVVDDVFELFDV